MLNQSIQPPTRNISHPGSNGLEEEEPEPTYPKREYVLEDFSQQAINRGQQEINYLITVADNTIVEALKQVSTAVAKLAACGQVDLNALDQAINAVSEATRKIAGPFPPGCASGVQTIEE